MTTMIKTRFAPSPTGELHIGGVRTALFAYLFAKSQGGEFLLRIEDTDRERFVEGSADRIIEVLKWLGMVPDNINNYPVQSDRLEVYKKHAFDLVRAGHAYICTCSKEKLAEDHERQTKDGTPPKYEGHCRTADLKLEDMKEGCYVIRMKMPKGEKMAVDDLIRGRVEFDTSLIDDQVILKSDGFPTYHLAVVVDDSEMGITHVIRGEEWLPSTPKHLMLYKYFGWNPPQFAHLPVILGTDKKKLSKRHGATSAMGYKEMGYLPEALINFLALLGWNPKDEREEFTLFELEKEFKLENVNKSGAIFDIEKLSHINAEKLKKLEPVKLRELMAEFGTNDLSDGEIALVQRGGYKTLKEAAEYVAQLRSGSDYDASMLVFRKSDREHTQKGLAAALEALQGIGSQQFTNETIEQALLRAVDSNGFSNGDVFWPVRVALSGEEKSPSPVELAVALGKDKTIERIKKALELVRQSE